METETIWIVLPATIYSFQNFEHVDLQTVALTGKTHKLIYQDSSCLVKSYNWAFYLQFSRTCRPHCWERQTQSTLLTYFPLKEANSQNKFQSMFFPISLFKDAALQWLLSVIRHLGFLINDWMKFVQPQVSCEGLNSSLWCVNTNCTVLRK